MAAKMIDEYVQEITKEHARCIKRNQHPEFEEKFNNALAVVDLINVLAAQQQAADHFHAAQLAFRDMRIKELEKRNAWQSNRIDQLGG